VGANVSVYDEKTGKGCIRHVGIRFSAATGEILVVLVTTGRKFPFANVLVRNLLKQFPGIVGIIQNIKPDAGNRILGHEEKLLFGSPYYHDIIGDVRFRIHYQSFMQIHTYQAEMLVSYLKSHIIQQADIVDAFSGIGFLGLSLASHVQHLYCIESNLHAVEDARFNAALNHIENADCLAGKVEDILPSLVRNRKIDTLIFDPPRKGLEPAMIPFLLEAAIPRIIYVSCNPATQFRDVQEFLRQGYHKTFGDLAATLFYNGQSGQTVTLSILRNGQQKDVRVTLGTIPSSGQ
jgi:23S rRNA (uracil1939-C5)-methyltransferase